MNCHDFRQTDSFTALTPEQQAHADSCAACARWLREMTALLIALAESPRLEPAPAFAARVRQRLELSRRVEEPVVAPAVASPVIPSAARNFVSNFAEAIAAGLVVCALGYLMHEFGLVAMLRFGFEALATRITEHLPARPAFVSLELPTLTAHGTRWLVAALCLVTMVMHEWMNRTTHTSEARR